MASVSQLAARAEFIMKRYEKYNQKEAERVLKDMDPFQELVYEMRLEIKNLSDKAEEVKKKKKSRSEIAAINAAIRKGKNELSLKLPTLAKLAKKKARKLSPEQKEERKRIIEAVENEIDEIADGTGQGKKTRKENLLAQRGPVEIKFDINNVQAYNMDHTTESNAFAQEWQVSKKRQDGQLDEIEKGVRTLKQIALDMGEEIKKQDPLIDSIDENVEKRTQELRVQNRKLKQMLGDLRSPQKMCVDLILVAILLGIGAYIVQLVKPQAVASAKNYVESATKNITTSVSDKVNTWQDSTPIVGRRLLREQRGPVFEYTPVLEAPLLYHYALPTSR